MSQLVAIQTHDDVAILVVNNPPVHALSAGVPDAIAGGVASAEADPSVRVIVLRGAGKTFVTGADIRQLEEIAWGRGPGAPSLRELLRQIEYCAKPVIMAIHGTALGGGLELAMAGHYPGCHSRRPARTARSESRDHCGCRGNTASAAAGGDTESHRDVRQRQADQSAGGTRGRRSYYANLLRTAEPFAIMTSGASRR